MSSLRTNLPDYENPRRPSRSLQGKVAIVMGAGSRSAGIGNGRAAAILLAEAGAFAVCADINLEWARMTVSMIEDEFGTGMAIEIEADVAKESDCKRVVEIAIEKYGHLDILINNVGVLGPQGSAVDVELAEWVKGLEINVSSMMLMTKYAVPEMEKNSPERIFGRGSIVNISSIAGLLGGTPMLLYHTSKGAVVNMTRAMAVHHGPMGIRVNCVCPGMLYTPMVYTHDSMNPELRETRRKRSLLQTEGNGWDCGAAVRFLASEEARWMTGVVVPVDAGSTCSTSVVTV